MSSFCRPTNRKPAVQPSRGRSRAAKLQAEGRLGHGGPERRETAGRPRPAAARVGQREASGGPRGLNGLLLLSASAVASIFGIKRPTRLLQYVHPGPRCHEALDTARFSGKPSRRPPSRRCEPGAKLLGRAATGRAARSWRGDCPGANGANDLGRCQAVLQATRGRACSAKRQCWTSKEVVIELRVPYRCSVESFGFHAVRLLTIA